MSRCIVTLLRKVELIGLSFYSAADCAVSRYLIEQKSWLLNVFRHKDPLSPGKESSRLAIHDRFRQLLEITMTSRPVQSDAIEPYWAKRRILTNDVATDVPATAADHEDLT